MLKGQCLCGGIQYEYNSDITELAICHCTQCKVAQGTAFATNAPLAAKGFSFSETGAKLKTYFSSPNKKRVFCETCGTPLYSQRTDMPDVLRLRVGTIMHGNIPEPDYEIFCDAKSDWLTLQGERPNYSGHKPS